MKVQYTPVLSDVACSRLTSACNKIISCQVWRSQAYPTPTLFPSPGPESQRQYSHSITDQKYWSKTTCKPTPNLCEARGYSPKVATIAQSSTCQFHSFPVPVPVLVHISEYSLRSANSSPNETEWSVVVVKQQPSSKVSEFIRTTRCRIRVKRQTLISAIQSKVSFVSGIPGTVSFVL